MQGKMFFRWLSAFSLGLALAALLISLPAIVRAQAAPEPDQEETHQPPGLQTGSLLFLEVSPAAFEVSLASGALLVQTLTISNISPGSLTFSVAELPAVSWLSENPASGTLSSGAAVTVVVTFDATFDATGLVPGVYTTTLVAVSNQTADLPVMVPITMTVSSGQTFIYLPSVFKNFGQTFIYYLPLVFKTPP